MDEIARAIDANTIMLVGSAPPYPYGVVDPLPDLAALAERHGLWMHVDACVGGMVLPFVRDLGHALPAFDFVLPAGQARSRSISTNMATPFTAAQSLLLRDEALLEYQRYQFDAWPVGSYTTTNFIGSRGGGPIASAWAVMKYLGFEGYRARVAKMLEAKEKVHRGHRDDRRARGVRDSGGNPFLLRLIPIRHHRGGRGDGAARVELRAAGRTPGHAAAAERVSPGNSE